MLTFKVSYPLSPLFVILDTFGPTALIALAVPFIGIWNVAPLVAMPDTSSLSGPGPGRRPTSAQQPQPQPMSQARVAVLAAVRAALGMSLYLRAPLLGSALSAAWLRRHLMVWEVLVPLNFSALTSRCWAGCGSVSAASSLESLACSCCPPLPLARVAGLSKDSDDKNTICHWIMIESFPL